MDMFDMHGGLQSFIMPKTLTLVRHGESESNAAKRMADELGASPAGEAELMAVHTSQRRLTARGVKQAQAAGAWLRAHFMELAKCERVEPFSNVAGYFSPYARA